MHTKIQTHRTLNGNSDFRAINIFLASHETRWEEERMENEKNVQLSFFFSNETLSQHLVL